MEKVQIVYDEDWHDVDVIAVPDDMVRTIDILSQRYLHWMPATSDECGWVVVNGRKVLNKETKGFVKWLNEIKPRGTDVYIVTQHCEFDKDLAFVEL